MRILFFIDNLNAGGKERRCVELLKGLNELPDIDFEIVVMDKNIHYKEIFELDTKIHYLLRTTKKDMTVFRKFYKICKEYKPDIVHCWNDMTAVIAVPACKLLHIKLINGMVADTPVKKKILDKAWIRGKLTFQFSDKVIGNSKAGLTGYGTPKKKSICIYNGMDLNRFADLKDANTLKKEIFGENRRDLFVVGMVAAFEPRKDYVTLIKAATELIPSNDSLRFILVGDGSDFHNIKNNVPDEFKNKIQFLGRRNDVESIVNLFNVGVLLTNSKAHGEGISNSIIEYMALGKPVIATRGGGTNEVVFNGENGFLIDSGDDSNLIKSIQTLIDDQQLKDRLGNTSRDMAYQKFDLKIMTRKYITTYQLVLTESKNK